MNTTDRKLKFVQEYLRLTDEDIIEKLEQLLGSERKKKVSRELDPLTMEEFNKKIDESEDDFKKGRFTESNDLFKSIDTWK